MSLRNCVVIGSGPAGLTAAIYLSRADLSPLVIEGFTPGGQLTTTTDIDNFPGFPEGISGNVLMDNMKKQAKRFATDFASTQITDVDLSKSPFTIFHNDGKTTQTKTIIIATGASAKYLGIDHETELLGRGVSACATCDGFFYKNKIVHVVGGGDTAMEESTFLTRFAKKVYLVHRRDSFRASKAMQDKIFNNPKIEVIWNTTVEKLLFNDMGLTGLMVKNIATKEISERSTDGLFLGIGHTPNIDFLKGKITVDEHNFIKTNTHMQTNVEGVFACGDIQDPRYRQAITAAGSGCMAAMSVEKYLEEQI